VLSTLPSGWRNVATSFQTTDLAIDEQVVRVEYRFERHRLSVHVDRSPLDHVDLVHCSPSEVVLELDGVRRAFTVHQTAGAVYVDSTLGHRRFSPVERFTVPVPQLPPGSLQAPMPGSVVRVLRRLGDRVEAGETVIVIEAMKMEHKIVAPRAGTITSLSVETGSQVDTGAVLAIVEPAEEADGD
jgi:propionyl-CoA carboxylase alpha chain